MNKNILTTLLTAAALGTAATATADVQKATRLNSRAVELVSTDGQTLLVDFYADNIFRMFRDDNGGVVRNPEAVPPAVILAPGARAKMGSVKLEETASKVNISTVSMELSFDKKTGALTVTDLRTGDKPVQIIGEPTLAPAATTLSLKAGDEWFYGGGVQNGRFSHRGEAIQIVNTNNWTDGGVASPTPFYWSTGGYGVMWHTFAPGKYDFGKTEKGTVTLTHEVNYLDVFVMVDKEPVALLQDFYLLTGNPVLLPKFGFYEGHLNAYNRDYWKEDENGILFEDGKKYKESQTDNGGIKESLNGELDNYQFSARAVVDRYEKADMPLGWVLPNDGYGAGYGQTETLDGNIRNLKDFGDYARSKGVEIGLWTQSDLHPKDGIEALLQRDIVKEVRDAGVRVLKTDVAWVGAGYSFGLNGVADVGEVMPYYGNEARPFIISLDGWAGTQRYAGIWTGDQTGGEWEYIRFHIPTYIGSGLSGQPNICSDMDGIFGGRNIPVNVRDFQWKTFTPMQLNMDGWGSNPKYPQALGKEAADINRQYLKLKAAFMPYTYSIAHEAVTGKPMVRAMFLEDCNDYTLGTATRYQFMYGPSILVAPIYKETNMKENGDDERDGIYLPEGEWIDAWAPYSVFQGGRILNDRPAPLEWMPYFYKRGAIIPMTEPHNNPSQVKADLRMYRIFPAEAQTSFMEYDDDGRTQAYLDNEYTTTLISQQVTTDKKGIKRLTVTIDPMEGSYEGMTTTRTTVLEILVSAAPKKITAKVGGKVVIPLVEMPAEETLDTKDENRFMRITLPAKDVRQKTELVVEGYSLNTSDPYICRHGAITAPVLKEVVTGPRTLTLKWEDQAPADYCEVEFEGRIYSTLTDNELLFEDLVPETEYSFRLRALNADGKTEWSNKITAKTDADPLEHAVRGMRGEATIADQGGQGVKNLFDFDESKGWHTAWSAPNSTPFDLIVDMRTVNKLDRMQYMPRPDAGNGTILKGTIAWSMDKQNWHDEQPFTWARDGKVKTFDFSQATPATMNSSAAPTMNQSEVQSSNANSPKSKVAPQARYIKIHIDEAVGGFGSGQELYIFRVPGSEYYIPGDVNHDNRIDENDLTSYMNYTGLRSGDPDYEGYMNQGDLDKNGLIDAYDISAVAIELESGVSSRKVPTIEGKLIVTQDKARYAAGDEMVITVSGKGLKSVNAFSLCLPYNADELEYLGTEAVGTKEMRNLTYDRLHSNGQKALYPTFVNCGEHPYIEGDCDILKIRFRAKKACKAPTAKDVMIVDKYLNRI